jgi:SagB-type dehydrogenase family enzyme
MISKSNSERLLENGREDLWCLYHENSKVTPLDAHPSDGAVVARMQASADSLTFKGYPLTELPPSKQLIIPLSQAIVQRESARSFIPDRLSAEEIATILWSSHGVSRENANTDFPRPFRVAPSGGALYPIEVFMYCSIDQELQSGLYHYGASSRELRFLNASQHLGSALIDAFVQKDLAKSASAIFIMTAFFDRSTFKYGERGYRFVMIEAGHIAQNIALVATGLGISCVSVGGYFDRTMDRLLDLDGTYQSVIYTVLVGGPRRREL